VIAYTFWWQMKNIDERMLAAFRAYGMSDREMDQLTYETDLINDLKIIGDDFGELYSHLEKSYRSDYKFEDYEIPSELSWDGFFLTLGMLFPVAKKFCKAGPLTIRQVHEKMKSRSPADPSR